MKTGFYRSQVVEVEDNYGGVVYKKAAHYYIAFVDSNNIYMILSSSKGEPKMSVLLSSSALMDIKGSITKENEITVEITFYNPFLKTREIFTGKKEGDKLYLKAHRENKPEEIFLDDVFEYIGTGE